MPVCVSHILVIYEPFDRLEKAFSRFMHRLSELQSESPPASGAPSLLFRMIGRAMLPGIG